MYLCCDASCLWLDSGNLVSLVYAVPREDVPFVVCTEGLALESENNASLSIHDVHPAATVIDSKDPAGQV